MSGQYKIQYSAMDEFYSQIDGRMAEWIGQLELWITAYKNIEMMESYKGKSAESVKSYLQEVHMLLLCSIQQAMQLYRTKYLLYRKGYYDIEEDLYASLPQEILINVKERMGKESEVVSNIEEQAGTYISGISDIMFLSNPSAFYVKDTMDGIKQKVSDFDKEIGDYELQHKAEAQGELAELLGELLATITEFYTNGTNPASYNLGDFVGNTHLPALCERVLLSSQYLEQNADEIQIAEAKMEEVFAQQYEEACKAREEEGAIKLLTGGVAAITGILAIVGTGGMATPVVVTAWVAGGSSVLYGASKIGEGAQDIYFANTNQLSN